MSLSGRKTERLLNLVICLLSTRRPLTVGQIRDAVPGYAPDGPDGDDVAARRMFERDKEELRDLGIPLETVTLPGFNDDEFGYRIARRDYELPPITLAPDEAAAVALAVRLWGSAGLAEAASSALLKLRAAGVEVDVQAAGAGFEPRVDASEPAFAACLAAVRAGRAVTFSYRGKEGGPLTDRDLEPWGVVSWRGRWYLVGHDRDRSGTRAFRLSRIASPVVARGPEGAVVRPESVDLVAAVSAGAADSATESAVVRVRPGRAFGLRRAATTVTAAGEWDELTLPYGDPARLADRVAGFGADAVIVSPPEARAAVIERLAALAGSPAADGEGA